MPTPAQNRVAAQIERAERRKLAVALAIDGVTYDEIAERLGYGSRQAAHKDVKAALAPAVRELTEAGKELVAVQAARLERMHRDARAIYDEFKVDEYGGALTPDQRLAAMDRMLRVGESLRKLVGADAPARTENRTVLDATVGYQVAVAPEELEQL